MAVITVGDIGTLKAVTAEGQLKEIITYLRIQELTVIKNPQQRNHVRARIDETNLVYTADWDLPLTRIPSTLATQGQGIWKPINYLIGDTFSPGVGGTFTSDSAPAMLMEIALYLQDLESSPTNSGFLNNVSGSISIDDKIFTGSCTFGLEISISATGGTCFTVKPYI